MVIRHRARNEDEKEERRRDILAAATALFEERSFAGTTMAEVAERVGVSKGALYLYFRTKEELFLALLEHELAAWFDEVEAQLGAPAAAEKGAPRGGEGQAVARILCATVAPRLRMTRLLTLLDGVLEHNIEEDVALRFKQFLAERVQRAGAAVERVLPGLRPGEGARLFLHLHALVVGLRQMAEPAPVVQRLSQRPELAMFRLDFAEELAAALGALLGGLEARRQGG